MGGICGVIYKNLEHKNRSGFDIQPMVKALSICGEGKSDIKGRWPVFFGSNGEGFHEAGVAERKIQEDFVFLVFEGNLFEVEALSLLQGARGDVLETLLAMYLKKGIDSLVQLEGEFSFALFDSKIETFYLATDRFRIRPVFYYEDKEKFIFSSRMISLSSFPGKLKLSVDPRAIIDVIGSSSIPTPRTIYREVKKLPPAHLLSFRKDTLSVQSYWNFDFIEQSRESEQELSHRLKATFERAVSIRATMDNGVRKIGTFLSGGVDSSTVTGLLTRLTGGPVSCFSIGFGESQFDEMEYARSAARTYGARHFEYYVTPADVQAALPILLDVFDEPFGNASSVPTYFCAKLAKEYDVEVLYAGDGGDELFAGNERYATQRFFDYYFLLPKALRSGVVEPLFGVLGGLSFLPWFSKGKKYIKRANIPYPDRLSSYGFFREVPLEQIFDATFLEQVGVDYDPYERIRHHYFEAPAKTNLDRQLYVDLQLIISDNDLFKVTRMTEGVGVAVRYPFLDYRLVELASQIPATLKMRGMKLRSFFKETYADLLPASTLKKQKHGFGLPIPIWLREDPYLNSLMHDLVLGERTVRRNIFRKEALENLISQHKADQTSFFGTALWNLMILELWFRKWEDRQTVSLNL